MVDKELIVKSKTELTKDTKKDNTSVNFYRKIKS